MGEVDVSLIVSEGTLVSMNPVPANWKKNLPMWLTLSRMFLAPLIIACMFSSAPLFGYVAALLFVLASLTDYWDGYFARKYAAESDMGKLLDPIADKVLVSSVLIMMVAVGYIDAILVMLLVNRDIVIGGLRAVAATRNVVIAAKTSGKWKTAVQMVGIPALLIHTPLLNVPLAPIGYGLLWISVVLSLVSAYDYVGIFRKT